MEGPFISFLCSVAAAHANFSEKLKRACLLISWLQSPSAVIVEPPKIKSVTVSIISPSICHEVMGLDAMTFVF